MQPAVIRNGEVAGIVTPEAVVLELETASVGTRVVAITLDLLIMGFGLTLVFFAAGAIMSVSSAAVPDWVAVVFVLLASFLVFFGYPAGCETWFRGRTLGKLVLGLRVVTVEGAPIRFRHATIRSMLGLVDFLLPPGGATAILTVLASRQNQRLGDLVAGTLVLQERQPGGRTTALWFLVPPGLEAYAATIDTTRMTPAQYRLVRGFLLRSGELDAGARWHHGVEIARRLSVRLGHLPPPGLPPEAFLTCAVAMYQRRNRPAPAPAPVDGDTPSAGRPVLPAVEAGGFAAPG